MSFRASTALAAVLVSLALNVSAADAAVTITNRDDKDHKLTVIEDDGAKKTDHVLKANQILENLCAKGCVIRLNDSEEDEYELEGNEAVSIEEGYLYYDSPEPPTEGQPGATQPGATPPPAKQ
jgi:hypothetical protein